MPKKTEVKAVNITTGEIKHFPSVRKAAEETKTPYPSVVKVLNGVSHQSHGWAFKFSNDEKPFDLESLRKRYRPDVDYAPKKGRPPKNKYQSMTFYFTKERGAQTEKVARYDDRGILQIQYNWYIQLPNDYDVPDLNFMQKDLKRKLDFSYEKSIVIYEGALSRKYKNVFYIYCELSIKTAPNQKPTEKQLRNLEKMITTLKAHDGNGRNTYAIERLHGRKYDRKYDELRRKNGETVRHIKRKKAAEQPTEKPKSILKPSASKMREFLSKMKGCQ